MPKIGLALSGGGSRCIAQLGAMHYFEEKGLKISEISGSSGGAIVAGLYAKGMKAKDIFSTLGEINFKSYLKYNIKNGSLHHLESAISSFQDIFGTIDIKDLEIPFYCTVVDYKSGEVEYKTEGDLVTMMLASSALVPFFAPVTYKGKVYIDGGFCDNLPSHPLRQTCDYVIGINVNPLFTNIKNSFKGHISRSMFIMLNRNIKAGRKECDLFMEIKAMGRYSIFDLKHFELFFDLGYNECKYYERELDELLYTKD
jgi:NTE family protein